jgi:hypothetical protein
MSDAYVPPRPDGRSDGVPSPWQPAVGPGTRPSWRRPTFGRVVLHVLAGGLIAFGLLIVMLVVVFAAGRSPDQFDVADRRAQAMLGGAFWVLLLGAETGWLLFVYLKASSVLRTAAFLVIVGLSLAAAIALGLSAIPRIA